MADVRDPGGFLAAAREHAARGQAYLNTLDCCGSADALADTLFKVKDGFRTAADCLEYFQRERERGE